MLSLPSSYDNEGLLRSIAAGDNYFNNDLFYWIADQLLKPFHNGFKNKKNIRLASVAELGFNYGIDDPAMLTAFEMNVFHFSAAKTLEEVRQLNDLYRNSKSFSEFYKEAQKITTVFNKTWMETEYNTAYQVGESAATYNRLIKQSDIFPYWQYKTQEDNQVRPTHQALDNLILPYNDPRWNSIYPPNGWNCRCYVVPRMKDEAESTDFEQQREKVSNYYETPEWRQNKAQGWATNRSKSGEVFTANQFYIRKFPGKASSYLNKLTYEKWGLKSAEKMRDEAGTALKSYEDTADEWWAKQKLADDNTALLTDYAGRKISLNKGNFKYHTTGSRKDRIKYLKALEETLKTPDEVWINAGTGSGKYDQMILIKYFSDEAITVINGLSDLELELKTWFPLFEKKKFVVRKYRRGLLIKK